VVDNGDGSFTARIPLSGNPRFLRLSIGVGN